MLQFDGKRSDGLLFGGLNDLKRLGYGILG
jgi:hypothetical protein